MFSEERLTPPPFMDLVSLADFFFRLGGRKNGRTAGQVLGLGTLPDITHNLMKTKIAWVPSLLLALAVSMSTTGKDKAPYLVFAAADRYRDFYRPVLLRCF